MQIIARLKPVNLICTLNAASLQVCVLLLLFCRQHGVRADEARRLQAAGATCVSAARADCGQWKSCAQQHEHTLGAGVRLRLRRRGFVLRGRGLHRHRPQHRRPAGYFRLHHDASG